MALLIYMTKGALIIQWPLCLFYGIINIALPMHLSYIRPRPNNLFFNGCLWRTSINDSNNYIAITLSSIIINLYEYIILDKLENQILLID